MLLCFVLLSVYLGQKYKMQFVSRKIGLILNTAYLQDYFPANNTAQLLSEQYGARQDAVNSKQIYLESEDRLKDSTSDEEVEQLKKSHQRNRNHLDIAVAKVCLIDDTLYYRSIVN